MPLKDHFHEPLESYCSWQSFHLHWAVKMVDRLNETWLPDDCRAQTDGNVGLPIVVSTAPAVGETETPPISCEADFTDPDLFELKVYRGGGGWNLVAAVELVSESNKDRDESSETFAVKCASYLKHGVSVVVIDVVTNRSGELHNDLCARLGAPAAARWTSRTGLSVIAYRGVRVKDKDRLDVWPHAVGVGDPLPTVPLWLAADLAVPLELELTYANAFKSLRIR